jgi:maltose phosphorylase
MSEYLTLNEWSVIEDGFHPELNKSSESIFSLGNGRMGHRGIFEEKYSGETTSGHYIAGQNAQLSLVPNGAENNIPAVNTTRNIAPSWIGINVEIAGYELDLATCQVLEFRRELNMREGYLYRRARVKLLDGKELEINSLRFTSLADDELGAIRYAVTPLNFTAPITLSPYLDAKDMAAKSYGGEYSWQEVSRNNTAGEAYLTTQLNNTHFQVCTGMRLMLEKDGSGVETTVELVDKEIYVGNKLTATIDAGQEFVLYKYAAVVSSENYAPEKLNIACELALDRATSIGFARLLDAHGEVWAEKWQESDVTIKGDLAAQQAIRFNIFQLHQAYTGEDERFYPNPAGFSGEKPNGFTNGETEIFCLPFYLATASPYVARNLLLYRYNQLPQAITNGKNLGFSEPALYPADSNNIKPVNSYKEDELGNIHPNAAVAYAIYNYVKYTGDQEFLAYYGLEILIATTRFFTQLFTADSTNQNSALLTLSGTKILKPNPENNRPIHSLATWTLQYTLETLQQVKEEYPDQYQILSRKVSLVEEKEIAQWQAIVNEFSSINIEKLEISGQQVEKLNNSQERTPRQDNKKSSEKSTEDSLLKKQEEVLTNIFLFEEQFDHDTIRHHLNLFNSITGTNNTPFLAIPAILAAKIGEEDLAYKYYEQLALSDLQNQSHETADGCLISRMAATWLVLIKGFGGMRVYQDQVHFQPILPAKWEKYSFKMRFRQHLLTLTVTPTEVKILNESEEAITLQVYGKSENIPANNFLKVNR